MSKKEKVKEFAKKNLKTIAIGVGLSAACFLVGYGGTSLIKDIVKPGKKTNASIPYDEVIATVLRDACAKHPGIHNSFGKRFDIPVTAKELGKLGESIMSCKDYDPSETFTHFIAIGESMNNKI